MLTIILVYLQQVYTVAVSEKEVLEAEIPKLRDTLSQREEEKSTREEKLGKVTDSLKKVSELFSFCENVETWGATVLDSRRHFT